MLIQIGHNGEWVNPKYVTSVEHTELYLSKLYDEDKNYNPGTPTKGSKLCVVGNAGYGTYSICTTLSPNQVAAKLNEQNKKG